ncbi:MAG: ATP-binding protein [Thermoanaerobaculia bacterium]
MDSLISNPTSSTPAQRDERVLILAPFGRDGRLAARALADNGLEPEVCRGISELVEMLRKGAGAAILTEEVLTRPAMEELRQFIDAQPGWSDFPFIVFCTADGVRLRNRPLEKFGPNANVTFLDRPTRIQTVVSTTRAALRARRRQYAARRLMAQLESRIRERDEFLAMLGHELRNPLAAIVMATQTVEGPLSAEVNHRVELIERQARHLARLVDDLLEVSRVTSGKISLVKRPIDFCDLVRHCIETIHAPHTIEVNVPDDACWVDADPVRLEQVVTNLLTNAVKYSPPKTPIRISIEPGENFIALHVKDDGIGVDPTLLPRIFDMFMQIDKTIDRSQGGLGLGLTLVRNLVEMHGGDVEARSDGIGKGTEFIVRLPSSENQERAEELPETDAVVGDARALSVVVIEDAADVRELLKIMIRKLGHEATAASNGMDGLDMIFESRPDVAVIDLGLPGIDGYHVARRVREEIGRSIYLVALSGYGQPEDRKRAADAGFDVHLTKPADLAMLRQALYQPGSSVAGG